MLKIATGTIRPDGSEQRHGVVEFPNLEAFCAALNKGSAPSTGKQRFGTYWSPFDTPRQKGAKPDWQLLVLDFDVEPPSETMAVYTKYERVEYQTASSTPDSPRYRVIIAVNEPIPYEHVDPLRRCFPGSDAAAVKTTQIFWHRHPEHRAAYIPGHVLNWRRDFGDANAPVPEQVQPSTPTMTRAALVEALYRLDPDAGYDEWIRIGQAIHHETSGSEDGFVEWLHWSERGAKFAGVNDLRNHWKSFNLGGGITGLSLLQMQTAKIDDFPIVTAEQARAPGLHFIPLRDFAIPDPPPYMVKGLIEQGSLIGLIGQRKGGKSYVALDLAFATSQGRPWAGADVISPGPVDWVAAEGARSLATRRAPQWLAHYGDADIQVYPRPINMRSKEHIGALIEHVKARGSRLVIIDSLRRVTPGAKENASDEFAVALANAEHIALETGATVCIIAHAGKADATSARGTSAIEDSLEIAFAVEKIDGAYKMTLPFARDEDDNDAPRYFALKRIEPPGLAPGVVVDWTITPVKERPKPRTDRQRRMYDIVKRAPISADGALDAYCQEYSGRRDNVRDTLRDMVRDGHFVEVDGLLTVDAEQAAIYDFETLMGVKDGD